MLKSLLVALLLVSSNPSFSQNLDPALVIAKVEVHQVETPVSLIENRINVELPKIPANPIDEIAMYVDGLIALGKKVWPIIQAGRPVLTTTGLIPSLSVLPHIEGDSARAEMYQMAGWSVPKSASYRVSFKNVYNFEVIGFTYTVFFQYNGSYQGNGKYLTSLKVQASNVYAAWGGFNFDAKSELINVANVGTSVDPVASAIIQVSYIAKGILNETRGSQSFFVDGSGNLKILNN